MKRNEVHLSLKGVFVLLIGFSVLMMIACGGGSSSNGSDNSDDSMTKDEIVGAGTQTGSTSFDAVFTDIVFDHVVTVNGGSSIQDAIDAVTSGQKTKIVVNGTHNEAVTIDGKSYIWLCGGTTPIIGGSGLTPVHEAESNQTEYLVFIKNSSYIKVSGITIQNHVIDDVNYTPTGIMVKSGCSNIEISGNTVKGIQNPQKDGNAHGIAVYGNTSTAISDILIDNNEVHSCVLGWSESMVLNGNVTNFTVSNNTVHDNNNIGIDFIGFEPETNSDESINQARNGICVGNTVYNITSKDNPAYEEGLSADGIYVDGGKNIIIERNTITTSDIGIEVASEHAGKTTENITVRNNFILNSNSASILTGGYDLDRGKSRNILIINNTTYKGADGELGLQNFCTGVLIANNIFYSVAGNSYVQDWGENNNCVSIYLTNNLYFNGESDSSGDWEDIAPLFADPEFVSTSSGAEDLHLQSASSPAIDAGNNSFGSLWGEKDIDGENREIRGVDLGADEFYY